MDTARKQGVRSGGSLKICMHALDLVTRAWPAGLQVMWLTCDVCCVAGAHVGFMKLQLLFWLRVTACRK
jgi:hypothetical protein